MPKFPARAGCRGERTKHENTAPPLTRKEVIIYLDYHYALTVSAHFFQFVGIVFSCYLGIGAGLGSMIGGFLIDIIGGSWTFLLSGGVTAIVLVLRVLSLVISRLLDRMKNSEMERKTEDYESS